VDCALSRSAASIPGTVLEIQQAIEDDRDGG
jgi:hypothetical protein